MSIKLNPERLRNYQLQKGAHKIKNRSSKHLRWLKSMKPIYKCMSNAQLNQLAGEDCFDAQFELNRREKGREKREVRMQRYREKLAAKRQAKAQ